MYIYSELFALHFYCIFCTIPHLKKQNNKKQFISRMGVKDRVILVIMEDGTYKLSFNSTRGYSCSFFTSSLGKGMNTLFLHPLSQLHTVTKISRHWYVTIADGEYIGRANTWVSHSHRNIYYRQRRSNRKKCLILIVNLKRVKLISETFVP